MSMTHSIRMLFFVFAAAVIFVAGAGHAQAQAWFATECQDDYQDEWLPTVRNYGICSRFNNELNDTDLHYYYYNLVGARSRWEHPLDQQYMDDVDLLYAATHGGIQTVASTWAMWDKKQRAYSSHMRLGDEAWNLSILATYACYTLMNIDGANWTRMGPIFRGGLRYMLGSHDLLYSGGSTTYEVGEDFADGLQKKKPLRYAWKEGNSDWWLDQDVAIMTTGANNNDCIGRRGSMTWQNFRYWTQLRNDKVGWVCTSKWDNI